MRAKTIIISAVCGIIGYGVGKRVALRQIINILQSKEMTDHIDEWVHKNYPNMIRKEEA